MSSTLAVHGPGLMVDPMKLALAFDAARKLSRFAE